MARNNLTWIKGDIYFDLVHLGGKEVQVLRPILMIKGVTGATRVCEQVSIRDTIPNLPGVHPPRVVVQIVFRLRFRFQNLVFQTLKPANQAARQISSRP